MNQAKSKSVEVITAVVDTKELTLYLKDGSTIAIQQGDARVKRIVDEITPVLMAGGIANVDLDYDKTHEFSDFEEKTGGIVKFFRVAKKKLTTFLARTEALFVDPQIIGGNKPHEEEVVGEKTEETTETIEEVAKIIAAIIPKEPTAVERMQQATAEIMKHAVPVTDHHFADHQVRDGQDDHALVAVVDKKVIPNVQHLHSQIKHVNQGGDSEGLVNLMKRLANVKRGHSVDDLMKFLKHGDLPIAKDGSIIIYKRLDHVSSDKGDYVDVHSKKVYQRVGDHVCMAEGLVDHNRRVECSNGLHVARRQYLSGFSGDRMIMAKVAPEDVIAVPQEDGNKMRVCGYHILFEVPKQDAVKLNSNRPISPQDETGKLLARALAGDFPPARRRVEITGGKGTGLVFTDLTETKEHVPSDLAPVGAIEDQQITGENTANGPKVDPAKVLPDAPKAEAKPLNRKEEVEQLLGIIVNGATALERSTAAQTLSTLRKKWKQSWAALDLDIKQVQKIERALSASPEAPAVKPVAKKVVKQVKENIARGNVPRSSNISAVGAADLVMAGKGPTPRLLQSSNGVGKVRKAPKAPAAPQVAAAPAKAPVRKPEPGDGPRVFIAYLMDDAMAGDVAAAEEIVNTKKGAKKSWDKLGVTAVQVHKIELLTKK